MDEIKIKGFVVYGRDGEGQPIAMTDAQRCWLRAFLLVSLCLPHDEEIVTIRHVIEQGKKKWAKKIRIEGDLNIELRLGDGGAVSSRLSFVGSAGPVVTLLVPSALCFQLFPQFFQFSFEVLMS